MTAKLTKVARNVDGLLISAIIEEAGGGNSPAVCGAVAKAALLGAEFYGDTFWIRWVYGSETGCIRGTLERSAVDFCLSFGIPIEP